MHIHRRRAAVAALDRMHASISYGSQGAGYFALAPGCLRRLVGDIALDRVVAVDVFDGQKLRGRDLDHLSLLPNLRELDLRRTQLSDEELCKLRPLTGLRGLSIESSELTDRGLLHLEGLAKLESLSLAGSNHITDRGMVRLRPIQSLKTLVLHKVPVGGAGLKDIATLPNLRQLHFYDCPVTDNALAHLKPLGLWYRGSYARPYIWVELVDTNVTRKGANRLQKMLPSAKVSYSGMKASPTLP